MNNNIGKYLNYLLFISLFLFVTPLFAAASNNTNNNNFLVISDIHLDQTTTHKMEISPTAYNGENDLDPATFEKLLADVSSNIKNGTLAPPQFILILGDIAGHNRPDINSVANNELKVFSELKKNFPATPIFYTFGNNDSFAINYGPFKDNNFPEQYKSPYDVAVLNAGWKNGFLSTGTMCAANNNNSFPCMMTEDTTNSYYAAYLAPQLKLISLNSIMFSYKRKIVGEQDAMQQLQWLEAQLKTAQAQQETVILAMHIPPGNNTYDHSVFWLQPEQTSFLKLINTYKKNIIGLLASHTHMEELKIIKTLDNETVTGVYFVPGLSTSHGNEPAVKEFAYANENGKWALTDYEVFHFSENNTKANKKKNMEENNVAFAKLYDYKNYYCTSTNEQMTDITACLNKITAEKMKVYLTAGNKNCCGSQIPFPDDIVIQVTSE